MIWKVSSGPSLLIARSVAVLAFSMGQPNMLPEQSNTNIISIGFRSIPPVSAGGTSISVKNPLRLSRCTRSPDFVLLPSAEYEHLRRLRAYSTVVRLSHELKDSGVTASKRHVASRGELEGRGWS